MSSPDSQGDAHGADSGPIDFIPPAGSGYTPPATGNGAEARSAETTPGYVEPFSPYPSAGGTPAAAYPPANPPASPYPPASPSASPYPPASPPVSPYPLADPYGTAYPPVGDFPQSTGYGQPSPGYGQPGTGYPQQYGTYPQTDYPAQEYASYPPLPDPYAPSPYAPPYMSGHNSTEKNSQGVAALVLGIVSCCCAGLFTGIIAIVLGAQGRKAADEGRATNKSVATAGMVLGIIGTVLVTLGWIFASLPRL